MTTFIIQAARAKLAELHALQRAGEDLEDWDAKQIEALETELGSIGTVDDNPHARAERGRIAVELFGFHDDAETIAADVIADILHWVALTTSPAHVPAAMFRATRYFIEEGQR
jgi:hypothetical protein